MSVLVVNAGSSSLKLRVLADAGEVTAGADLPAPRGTSDADAIKAAIESFGAVDAVGHRIVHGGTLHTSPIVVDAQVTRRLEGLRFDRGDPSRKVTKVPGYGSHGPLAGAVRP